MKISKKDALMWFRFFAELPDDEELMPHQQEIALAALAQIETAVNKRREALAAKIDGLQSLSGRTYFVGNKGGISARLLLLPVGHRAERGSQDEQMQRSMQILL